MATPNPDPNSIPARDPGILRSVIDGDDVDQWEVYRKRADAADRQAASVPQGSGWDDADPLRAPVSANAESAAQTETPRMVTGYCRLCAAGYPASNGAHYEYDEETGRRYNLGPCTGEHAPGLRNVSADAPVSADVENVSFDGIRALMQAATPAPWNVWRGVQYDGGGEDICIGAGETWLANMDHRQPRCPQIMDDGHNSAECDICTIDSGNITNEEVANAEFIAAARNTLPEIFKTLDRLTAERDAARAELAQAKKAIFDCLAIMADNGLSVPSERMEPIRRAAK